MTRFVPRGFSGRDDRNDALVTPIAMADDQDPRIGALAKDDEAVLSLGIVRVRDDQSGILTRIPSWPPRSSRHACSGWTWPSFHPTQNVNLSYLYYNYVQPFFNVLYSRNTQNLCGNRAVNKRTYGKVDGAETISFGGARC